VFVASCDTDPLLVRDSDVQRAVAGLAAVAEVR